MKLLVNGKPLMLAGHGTLDALFKKIHVKAKSVAIMVNDEVVGKDKLNSVRLKDGDRIELLTFAGGG